MADSMDVTTAVCSAASTDDKMADSMDESTAAHSAELLVARSAARLVAM